MRFRGEVIKLAGQQFETGDFTKVTTGHGGLNKTTEESSNKPTVLKALFPSDILQQMIGGLEES